MSFLSRYVIKRKVTVSIIISFNIIIIIKNIRIISINIHNTVFRIITIGFICCTVNLN